LRLFFGVFIIEIPLYTTGLFGAGTRDVPADPARRQDHRDCPQFSQ
jgi:hypothetical protein